jgi:cysteine desulfurase
MDAEAARIGALRDLLRDRLMSELDEVRLNGHPDRRLPGNLNLCFAYVEGESLLMALRDVALSSGSACTSASMEPSHVLRAIGLSDEQAHSSIRFGIGRFNSDSDITVVGDRVIAEVKRLRRLSPFYAAKSDADTNRAASR